mmetsp:Transcript_7588/g.12264  ORF Transcript_7588/g.12264 Transcript_7588/m.12264 type:complete len:219 (+) Transcript_7588:2604-3260(+)
MKMHRSFAARIHSFKLTVVRRSSSMIPTLIVFRASPSSCSTRPSILTVYATSSGPCCFGLTMYILPVREFFSCFAVPFRSWRAASVVTMASTSPSGTSLSVATNLTASVYIWIPTFRTSRTTRPGITRGAPVATDVNLLSGFSFRTISFPPLVNFSASVPFMSPFQFRYTTDLSAASTAATESSQSAIAVIADSSMISLTPAGCVEPTWLFASIWIST